MKKWGIVALIVLSCTTCKKNYRDCLVCDCGGLKEPEIISKSDTTLVWIANSFTPNDDGKNENFAPRVNSTTGMYILSDWQLDIYTRHKSRLIFRSRYEETGQPWVKGWDGKDQDGKELGDRIFFYRFTATNNSGEKLHYEGELYKNSRGCLSGKHINKCRFGDQIVPTQGFVMPTQEVICKD